MNTPKRVKLNVALKPVPTIIPPSQKVHNLPPAPILESITNARQPPKIRIFQEDELEKFRKQDIIENMADIASKGPKCLLGDEFTFQKMDDHILIYKLEKSIENVPEVIRSAFELKHRCV